LDELAASKAEALQAHRALDNVVELRTVVAKELAASKEANRVALEALSMPCDRWNGTQAKIVSAAITQL
jgi:hypothetical protein